MDSEVPGEGRSCLIAEVTVVNGRKQIQLRSSLIVKSNLDIPVEIRIEFPNVMRAPVTAPAIKPKMQYAVPVNCTGGVLRVRPHLTGYEWSMTSLAWDQLLNSSSPIASRGAMLTCRRLGSGGSENDVRSRFCATIERETFFLGSRLHYGFKVVLHPPLTIENLLPSELRFDVPAIPVRDYLLPGCNRSYYEADINSDIIMYADVDGYDTSHPAFICTASSRSIDAHVYLIERGSKAPHGQLVLNLIESIIPLAGGARKVSIVAPYWIINRTGLPLHVKQV